MTQPSNLTLSPALVNDRSDMSSAPSAERETPRVHVGTDCTVPTSPRIGDQSQGRSTPHCCTGQNSIPV